MLGGEMSEDLSGASVREMLKRLSTLASTNRWPEHDKYIDAVDAEIQRRLAGRAPNSARGSEWLTG